MIFKTHMEDIHKMSYERPVANFIKLFCRNYVAIGASSVKLIGKYATSGITYAKKVL
jgi:hypothetical protein